MPKRRKKYQTASKYGGRKFAVKPGKYYIFSAVKQFNSKTKAKAWTTKDRKRSSSARHRIVKNPTKRKGVIKSKKGKYNKNYSVYRTYYP